MGDRASIYDVAREAGVALGTVSRVLNGAASVSDPTRRRVLDAIERLDYRPSSVARSLAMGATRSLAMLVPDLDNPLFGAIATGAQDAADELDHIVLVYGTDGSRERELRSIESMLDREVDGLLLVGSVLPADELATVAARIPLVQIGRQHEIPGSLVVHVDQALGARQAVEHLIALGHRRIALLESPAANDAARERSEGCRAALTAAGIPLDPRLVASGELNERGGARAMAELLARGAGPTAVSAATDLMAMGAMSTLLRAGLRIPRDVSVAGFDDIRISEFLPIPLTTVRQPARELGARAVRMLLQAEHEDARSVVLPTELVVRDSTAPV